jgi:methionyl-tRNA formyltransferase
MPAFQFDSIHSENGQEKQSAMRLSFGHIDRVALFGGSWLMAALCRRLVQRDLDVMLFAGPRHLDDAVEKDGTTLRQVVEQLRVPYCSTEDINDEPALLDFVTPSTLGLALGAAWVFEKRLVGRFSGKLLDFMGIALPQYRGGAHYTWQILRKSRQGCCNLQVIHGGIETFHRGEIVKRKAYFFPTSVRIPQDYFDAAIPHELAFLEEFFDQVERGEAFEVQPLQESFSTYFPFLNTLRHGFIDWRWRTEEIERFICAFDSPYAGASTFVNGQRVYLKSCHAEYSDGAFHPFQSGLVYRKTDSALFVATRDGTLVVEQVLDEGGLDVLEEVELGHRLYTPLRYLEEAMIFQAVYGPEGIRENHQT